ncbi:unnamed protein product [Effrenium voratum]|uniref:Uncharacterized protein n=1 Tax=Effrenium voratum TaxID=2562239 RepID=A0AA36I5C9_9DINO|nr:unnamed protein product [Effrenium voratum]
MRPGYWDIHIPPNSGSSYVVEDTMEDHAGCEVVKTCCDDQFSLCFSGNASRTVEVQRVDSEIGWPQQVGWGQDLYLRCYAPSVASFAPSTVPAEPPWYLRLEESTHVTAKLDFHHGNVIGGCECSNHAIQTRVSGSDWIDAGGDCLARDTRTCTLENLADASDRFGPARGSCDE